jgi:hypothetical protein
MLKTIAVDIQIEKRWPDDIMEIEFECDSSLASEKIAAKDDRYFPTPWKSPSRKFHASKQQGEE